MMRRDDAKLGEHSQDRSIPKILESLDKKVSALAERQKELEGKLTSAEVV